MFLNDGDFCSVLPLSRKYQCRLMAIQPVSGRNLAQWQIVRKLFGTETAQISKKNANFLHRLRTPLLEHYDVSVGFLRKSANFCFPLHMISQNYGLQFSVLLKIAQNKIHAPWRNTFNLCVISVLKILMICLA